MHDRIGHVSFCHNRWGAYCNEQTRAITFSYFSSEKFTDNYILVTSIFNQVIFIISKLTGFRKILPIDMTKSRGPTAVDYDYCHRYVVWVDMIDEKVIRARLNGSDYEELIWENLNLPIGKSPVLVDNVIL